MALRVRLRPGEPAASQAVSSPRAARQPDMLNFGASLQQAPERMEMNSERSKESVYCWNKTAEKSDFEAVEALMSMSCSWKSDFKKYLENRPVTPVSDLSEEENLLPGTPDFHTIPAFCLTPLTAPRTLNPRKRPICWHQRHLLGTSNPSQTPPSLTLPLPLSRKKRRARWCSPSSPRLRQPA